MHCHPTNGERLFSHGRTRLHSGFNGGWATQTARHLHLSPCAAAASRRADVPASNPDPPCCSNQQKLSTKEYYWTGGKWVVWCKILSRMRWKKNRYRRVSFLFPAELVGIEEVIRADPLLSQQHQFLYDVVSLSLSLSFSVSLSLHRASSFTNNPDGQLTKLQNGFEKNKTGGRVKNTHVTWTCGASYPLSRDHLCATDQQDGRHEFLNKHRTNPWRYAAGPFGCLKTSAHIFLDLY